jgi:hypothetical protein
VAGAAPGGSYAYDALPGYYDDTYYDYPDDYYDNGVTVAPAPAGVRSYDPATGTYLGYSVTPVPFFSLRHEERRLEAPLFCERIASAPRPGSGMV